MGYLSCRAESSVSTANSQNPNTNPNPNPIKVQHFSYSDLEAATNGFSDQKLLGKGSHGSVYKAVLRGRHVAVKRPSSSSSRPHHHSQTPPPLNEVDNEIEILSHIHSPRLVNLVGFTSDEINHRHRRRLLVVEFMSNGTLYDALHGPNHHPKLSAGWARRIKLALQTAKAIETLHGSTPPVIHRDVKSANVLIDRDFNARLGDFGLALRCHVDDFRLKSTPPAGTIGYLDPSYVTPDNLTTKLDVFSFGILLLEIISGRKAIDVGHSPPSIVDWAIPMIKKGNLEPLYDPRVGPPRDPVVTRQLAVVAAKCVRSLPERRPAMKEVVVWLSGLSELVRVNHPWVNNPCLMVENVGRPVYLGSKKEDSGESPSSRQVVRNSRRVYSDLGFSSNLMELMAGDDDNGGGGDDVAGSSVKLREWVFSGSRKFGGSERFGRDLKRNELVGGGGGGENGNLTRSSMMICSKIDDVVLRGSFRSQSTAEL